MSRRGLLTGAVAAALTAATGTAATAAPARPADGPPPGTSAGSAPRNAAPRFEIPEYRTTVPGESVETDRVDTPVAPGIVLTTFATYGRTGWTRVHVLNADLRDTDVGVGLLAGRVSATSTPSELAAAHGAVAAVNGDFFDITRTNAAIGPEIQDGRVRKGAATATTAVTVGADRVARLADLLIQGTVTVTGTARPLAALNSPAPPADGLTVYTPLWGPGPRTTVTAPGPYTELVVTGGTVTAVHDRLTDTAVPEDGLIVVGRGTAAARLAAARPGDPVTVGFAPRSDAPAAPRTALGSGAVLVRDGRAVDFPPSEGNDAGKPRTVIGWPAGGHRLLLVAVDGSADFSAGLTYDATAALLVRLGAAEAFMLDGGGSTGMVARHPGDRAVTVVNTPSDGAERPVPNGVGLFGPTGSGTLRGLDVRPAADRVVPGLTLDVTAAGHDETWSPATTDGHRIDWAARPRTLGRTADGVFRAGRPGTGTLTARAGAAHGEHPLRVVGPLHRLAFTEPVLTVEPGATALTTLTGYDTDGFDAPVAGRDATLDHDKAVVDVGVTADGHLAVTGVAASGGESTVLTATVDGVTARLTVTVGLADVPLTEFEPDETWTALATRATATAQAVTAPDRPGAAPDNHALRLTYDFTGRTSTSAAYAVAGTPITLPAGTRRLALWVKGDGRGHWLRAMLRSRSTTNVPFTFTTAVDWTGWRRVVGDVPAGFSGPVTLLRLYLVETSQTNKNAGAVEFDALVAQTGQRPETTAPPLSDPYVVGQAGLPRGRWTFAVLSDLHVGAAAGPDSFSARQAAVALDQAVAAGPDFLLINGDFVDDNGPADFDLAHTLLRDHVPAGLPVYWTPGNHEAGLSATGGLDAFLAATGRPNRQTFDHKGTRFVLLDSHTGDIRTSDWDQVPALRAALDRAARDSAVTGVVVSFHHPLHDPSGAGTSQLSDRLSAELLTRWLADFRETSGKPVALFTGHAHTASVTRADGVLNVTTPAVGKTPYSSPDQGGFFGWMHVAVDPRPARIRPGLPSPRTRDWLQAESRPLIDTVEVTAPAELATGTSAAVSATGITTEYGLAFPLRHPASVVWSGSPGLAVTASAAAAKRAAASRRTLAVLDLTAHTLTAVRPGRVTLTVASGGRTGSVTVALTGP
ncbi:phosphodiester glycosidase family protein [Streptomyces sp. CRN 30]|uniref:phosphodiester glycosidase family protein n=1 Tax=Streptomyces sp. CRN 30 TaxID=3075613 RepID=UPI002A806062|nr:phosphodiester glycosidase family protein [Streptomyces sp. CRN 30]